MGAASTSAAGSTPLNENATRGRHFKEIRSGRAWQLSTAICALVALVGGVIGAGVAGLAAPVVVVLLALVIAFWLADRRAHGDFWTGLAASMGYTYQGEVKLPAYTPLLAAGDRRSCPEWMTGKLEDGRNCAVGNYTYEVRQENGDEPDTWTSYDFTLAMIDIAPPEVSFVRGVYLRPRNRLRFFGEATLPGVRKDRLETESSAFKDKYDLYVDPDDDKSRVLEIFSPSFIDALAKHEGGMCFDYRGGSLGVFVKDHSDDAGRLLSVMESAKWVCKRIDEEIAESRAARGDAGVRPV